MAGPNVKALLKDKVRLTLLGGSFLVVASIFLPWWSLHSSVVNGQQALFDFTIGPSGMGINTIVGDPRTLLAELQVVYVIVTIALLPISVSLGLAAFHGAYCALRGRRGVRVLIGPLWAVIALFWWTFYFLLVYGFFEALGLTIPPTGSADVSWQGYQLVGATWGWDVGLWLAIAGTGVLSAGAALSMRGARAQVPLPEGTRLAFGFHGVGLILLALANLGAMELMLASLPGSAIAWLILVPVVLLFAMAFFARRPKAAAAPRRPLVPALPKIEVPSVRLPKLSLPGRTSPREPDPAPRVAAETPAVPESFPCDRCGRSLPTRVQLDAHRITHAAASQAADARRKMDELGKKLLGRP